LDKKVGSDALKVREEGETFIKNIELREKESREQLQFDASEKARRIEEEAARAKQKVYLDNVKEWEQIKQQSKQSVDAAKKEIDDEDKRARQVEEASKLWYSKEEAPFLKHLEVEEEAKDKFLRHQARVKTEYNLMTIEQEVPVGGKFVDVN